MIAWDLFVNLLQTGIFAFAQACGGNVAAGIVGFTFLLRLAMLPLTLRLARFSAAQAKLMRELKPELDRLRERHKNDRKRLAAEMQAALQRAGYAPFGGCLGILLQTPILLAMFSAVRRCAAAGGRFLWVRNIARPDIFLGLIVAGLTSALMATNSIGIEEKRNLMTVLATGMTFCVLLFTSAGVALYWGTSNLVGLIQNALLRRERRAVEGNA